MTQPNTGQAQKAPKMTHIPDKSIPKELWPYYVYWEDGGEQWAFEEAIRTMLSLGWQPPEKVNKLMNRYLLLNRRVKILTDAIEKKARECWCIKTECHCGLCITLALFNASGKGGGE